MIKINTASLEEKHKEMSDMVPYCMSPCSVFIINVIEHPCRKFLPYFFVCRTQNSY